MVTKISASIDWYGGADVCVALVPWDQPVDWSPGGFVPIQQIWVPEYTFERISKETQKLGLFLVDASHLHEQSRLTPAQCVELIRRWTEVEDATEQTPAHGWAVAIRLLIEHCAKLCSGLELLIEGP